MPFNFDLRHKFFEEKKMIYKMKKEAKNVILFEVEKQL